ncbi:LysR family transcriptional regulator [Paenibacillus nasutitermitis]|uniref:HTH-type transcriptional regulator CzcR n=1 Tax=Paenibacillus nasutitermitis TaxID=1652958 RepID=A0A916YPZ2_9BACL|nr:LysR family transcriptional regulator [Paenibacillus nasutitermitis]GGD55604.1 HTH-type transcriptional regulator CzcR [Paenibacillus nasutitermitis]
MELTDLKVFVSVAEEHSISRAAKRLEYVQSNVTARIRKLEAELGVSLFHRHPKGVSLTDRGTAFLDYALTILNLADEAIKNVREKSYPSGMLTIGVAETATCGNFMNTLTTFQSKYPDVMLTLITGNTSELLNHLMNHQVDGAFLTGNLEILDEKARLNVDYSIQEEIVLLSKNNAGPLADLPNMKWAVSPRGSHFRSILEQWLRSEGIPLTNFIEISSLDTLLSSVRAGLASTLLPSSVLTGEYNTLGSRSIPEKYRFTTTSFVRRKEKFNSKALEAFVEMINIHGL